MIIIALLAVIGLIGVTFLIIKQETPEQKKNDEKYKTKEHKLIDTFSEIKQAVKSSSK